MNVDRCLRHNRLLEFQVVTSGEVVAWCQACEWNRQKRCLDCGAARVKPNARCTPCQRRKIRLAARRKRSRECRKVRCNNLVVPGSKRQYCSDECSREERNRRYRDRYRRRPAFRQKQADRKKKWRQTSDGIRSGHRSKEKQRKSGTWGYASREQYLAAMRGHNAKPGRAESRRRWAHENQTMYVGRGEWPTCVDCQNPVSWSGRGRPRKRCDDCFT